MSGQDSAICDGLLSGLLADLLRDARGVVILGENDRRIDEMGAVQWPGRDGAESVARTLAERWGRPVRWCMPPANAKDLRELYAAHGAEGGAMLREHIEREAETIEPPTRPDTLNYEPFPVDALPPVLRVCAESNGRTINTDPAGIVLPMLVACARAVSRSRQVDLGRNFRQPLILWGCTVGAPSDGKTPAFDVAMEPVRKMRGRQDDANREARKEHRQAMELHKAKHAAWRKRAEKPGCDELPPEEPEPPAAVQVSCSDSTPEAIQALMAANGGPLLIERDELGAVFEAFGKYAGTGSGDAAAMCQAWNGGPWDCSRLSRDADLVRRACLNIAGGMTLGTLIDLFPKYVRSGMFARLLMVAPPMLDAVPWISNIPEPRGAAEYEQAWLALWALKPGTDGEREQPVSLTLTREALQVFSDARHRYKLEHARSRNDEAWAAFVGKLDAQLARIAGVLHLVRLVSGDGDPHPERIDADTMRNAVRIADWLRRENWRIYQQLREGDKARANRELAALVERNGGTMTPAELRRLNRAYETTPEAAEALRGLAAARWGVFIESPAPGPQGGRPKSGEFRLYPERKPPAEDAAPEVSQTDPADDSEPDTGDDDGWRDVGAA